MNNIKQTTPYILSAIALLISIYNLLKVSKEIIFERIIIREDNSNKNNENIQLKNLDEVNERIESFKKKSRDKKEFAKENSES